MTYESRSPDGDGRPQSAGRDVLLIGRGGYPDVGRWFEPYSNEPGWWAVHAIRWEPSHWMPLPDPPAVRGEGSS